MVALSAAPTAAAPTASTAACALLRNCRKAFWFSGLGFGGRLTTKQLIAHGCLGACGCAIRHAPKSLSRARGRCVPLLPLSTVSVLSPKLQRDPFAETSMLGSPTVLVCALSVPQRRSQLPCVAAALHCGRPCRCSTPQAQQTCRKLGHGPRTDY